MPALSDRDLHEEALASDLASLFAAQQSRIERGGPDQGWSQFRADLQRTFQGRIEPVVLSAAGGMPGAVNSPSLLLIGVSKTAGTLHSMQLADEIVARSRNRLAAGQSPAAVFGPARASRIAVTEITRSVSHAEHFAAATFQTPGQRVLTPTWHTEEDDDVCETCEPLDGKGRDIYGVRFPFGPPAHDSCRCWLDWE
jgi:hypothetical protein